MSAIAAFSSWPSPLRQSDTGSLRDLGVWSIYIGPTRSIVFDHQSMDSMWINSSTEDPMHLLGQGLIITELQLTKDPAWWGWTNGFAFFLCIKWGGISSEEHDDAVMLEAAIFGGIPEGNAYHRFAYPLHDALHAGLDRNAGLYPRPVPRPPSPTLVAQRLLREQQVYLLSCSQSLW